LKKLNPFVKDGIIRAGGRLAKASLTLDQKYPIILPSNHHFTRLVIEHHHYKNGHVGMGLTWSALRQKYWIIKGGQPYDAFWDIA